MRIFYYTVSVIVACALTPRLSHSDGDVSGIVSVNVVSSKTILPPPQAASAGFTDLARNSDFSKAGPDIGCDDTGHHDWYVHTQTALYADCSQIKWPVTDPVSGETVRSV